MPWTVANVTQATGQGTNFLTLDDSADANNVISSVTTTKIPINQLVNGQPVYDGGAASPTAEYFFGGEPVIDPFTHQPLVYSGGEPVLNLLTGQPEFDPFGNPIQHNAGDPMLHIAGDPVVHGTGDPVLYLGGELVHDENGNLVTTSAATFGRPEPDLCPGRWQSARHDHHQLRQLAHRPVTGVGNESLGNSQWGGRRRVHDHRRR